MTIHYYKVSSSERIKHLDNEMLNVLPSVLQRSYMTEVSKHRVCWEEQKLLHHVDMLLQRSPLRALNSWSGRTSHPHCVAWQCCSEASHLQRLGFSKQAMQSDVRKGIHATCSAQSDLREVTWSTQLAQNDFHRVTCLAVILCALRRWVTCGGRRVPCAKRCA